MGFTGKKPGVAGVTDRRTAAATLAAGRLGARWAGPTQLEGKDADARTDIFAFGAVVYEMATGQRAFTGDSQASLIGAILKDEPPPMSTLQPVTPVALDYIVRTCLAKARDERWQSAGDIGRQVRGIIDGGSQPSVAVPDAAALQAVGWRRAVVASLATLILGGATVGFAIWSATRPADPPAEAVRRFAVDIGPAAAMADNNMHVQLAWSPDGTRLAYAASLTSAPRNVPRAGGDAPVWGAPQLYVRDLDDLEARPLDGTMRGQQPFFSPNGEWVGFFRRGELADIPAEAGRRRRRHAADGGRGIPTGGPWCDLAPGWQHHPAAPCGRRARQNYSSPNPRDGRHA